MTLWDQWKKGFDTWEEKTAALLEGVLKSERVLSPVGSVLTATLRVKAATGRAAASWWGTLGLPTKREQEQTLHALNQIQSRLADLEERLVELQSNQKSPLN